MQWPGGLQSAINENDSEFNGLVSFKHLFSSSAATCATNRDSFVPIWFYRRITDIFVSFSDLKLSKRRKISSSNVLEPQSNRVKNLSFANKERKGKDGGNVFLVEKYQTKFFFT